MDVANIIRNKDIFSTVFNVAETTNVFITFGKDTTITSAEEIEQHDYDTRVKKNGLLGGGLGFTIGSIAGNVTIEADKDVHVNAADIIAGKNISMTGENVEITSKDNIYHSDEKHEYKKSGLTVSVGGATIDAINSVVQPITRAGEVKDKRLAGMYVVKAGQEANQIAKSYKNQQDVIDSLNDKAGNDVTIENGYNEATDDYGLNNTPAKSRRVFFRFKAAIPAKAVFKAQSHFHTEVDYSSTLKLSSFP